MKHEKPCPERDKKGNQVGAAYQSTGMLRDVHPFRLALRYARNGLTIKQETSSEGLQYKGELYVAPPKSTEMADLGKYHFYNLDGMGLSRNTTDKSIPEPVAALRSAAFYSDDMFKPCPVC